MLLTPVEGNVALPVAGPAENTNRPMPESNPAAGQKPHHHQPGTKKEVRIMERLRAERKGQQQVAMEMRKIIWRPDLPERLTQFLTESNVDANRRLRP